MSVRLPAILLSLICLLLVLQNGALHVESARSTFRWRNGTRTGTNTFHWYNGLFVFGDSFADTGNFPKSKLSEVTRQWYKPYGTSPVMFVPDPAGRFSDGLVQSDLIAKILKRWSAPKTYRSTKGSYADDFGVNFAVGGAGVFEVPRKAPTLAKQIDSFKKMLDAGDIGKWLLHESVALVAISGNDYARVANNMSGGDGEVLGFIGNVTDEIARGVRRLREMGVTRVLVNTLHPLGCTPAQTRPTNYTRCTARGNMAAEVHNDDLRKNLHAASGVHLLDLHRAFTKIINPSHHSHHHHHHIPKVAKQIVRNKLKPCCESFDPSGYCGQVNEDGDALYSVCSKPEKHFFWDDVHPTQAGWEAVMKLLEQDTKNFLHITY